MNYLDFISKDKSLLIAPAGFGKTHSLAECLNHSPEGMRQLILTHTHAGIASIKEKVNKFNIPSTKYQIETITGFAQKYTLAFYCGNDIPKPEDSNEYYPFIVDKATELFAIETIRNTIKYSFQGLFVDEYQDCTELQHKMISALSEVLPTHLLGDPMQGIFNFNGDLVDFENDLSDYEEVEPLDTPWRWINVGRDDLGNDLRDIRTSLQNGLAIKLNSHNSLETVICNERDLYSPRTLYRNRLTSLFDEESLLVIHPISSSIEPRIKILKSFNNRLILLESIDDKDSYNLSQIIDDWVDEPIILLVKKLSYLLFNKTGLDIWFNSTGLKRKTNPETKKASNEIQALVDELEAEMEYSKLGYLLMNILQLSGIKCYRKSLFVGLQRALIISETENISVYDAMIKHKNKIRRVGRKVYGKCIGTTLLTKGLEFDTVAILNAHQFEDYKHFYVAITRACKRIVIFSQSNEINFNR